jgi:tRNA-dihydrouridine synthase B
MSSSPFSRPFALGGVTVSNRVILAPMAGLTTSAYRRHLKRHGAGLITSEMVSVHGLRYGDRRTAGYLLFREEERPFALQLFGEGPDAVGEAVRIVLDRDELPEVIDLNMGCPVPKVAKTGAGCALMGDPARAAAVMCAAVAAAAPRGVPVTAKIRSGLDDGRINAVEVALRLEEAGAAGIGVHPRTAAQSYQGEADHAVTAAVAAAVDVPVVASGDVVSVATARRIIDETGAAAVMVARGARGNPWLVDDLLAGGDSPLPPLPVVVTDLRRLLALAEEDMGARRAGLWIRKLLRAYLRPAGVSGPVVGKLMQLPDAAALDRALAALAPGAPSRFAVD